MKKTTTSDLALTSRCELKTVLVEACGGFWKSFDQLCLIAGTTTLSEMLEEDVNALAGDSYARNADKPGYRWDSTKGRLGFHGGKVELERQNWSLFRESSGRSSFPTQESR